MWNYEDGVDMHSSVYVLKRFPGLRRCFPADHMAALKRVTQYIGKRKDFEVSSIVQVLTWVVEYLVMTLEEPLDTLATRYSFCLRFVTVSIVFVFRPSISMPTVQRYLGI